jgi:phosphoglycolate phosphatase-like HAD superfamily hydrolase
VRREAEIFDVDGTLCDVASVHDGRPDVEVKREILAQVRQRYDVVRAWDDNPHVVALWESEGVPVTLVPGWDEAERR